MVNLCYSDSTYCRICKLRQTVIALRCIECNRKVSHHGHRYSDKNGKYSRRIPRKYIELTIWDVLENIG